jgi:hypothetical protein
MALGPAKSTDRPAPGMMTKKDTRSHMDMIGYEISSLARNDFLGSAGKDLTAALSLPYNLSQC